MQSPLSSYSVAWSVLEHSYQVSICVYKPYCVCIHVLVTVYCFGRLLVLMYLVESCIRRLICSS